MRNLGRLRSKKALVGVMIKEASQTLLQSQAVPGFENVY
jgi:hypothetical protein